jgi:hypothetical protein
MLISCGLLYAQTLDESIRNAASEMSNRLDGGSSVAIINFQSQSTRLTNYVIDELNVALINIGKLKPVERRRLDSIRGELQFNMSGEVSDESAQGIGRMLGANSIIMGSIEIIGSNYRIRFQVIATETATIQYAFSQNINNDNILENLLKGTNFLVDFSTEQRLGASTLNLLFGTGSFLIEGDKFGGGLTAITEGIGVGFIIYAVASFNTIPKANREEYETLTTYDDAALPFFIGLGCYLGGAIFGIIRAQVFHKPGSQVTLNQQDRFRIDPVFLGELNTGVRVSYIWRF